MDNNFENTRSLGERLYILREQHNLSQDELAEILDVSRQTISNWENDKVKIDVNKAAELCTYYGISMDKLFLGSEQTISSISKQNERDKKRDKKLIIFCLALAASLILIVLAAIFLATSNAETSSALYLSEKTGWGIAIVCGVILCVVFSVLIYRQNRK